MKVLVGAFNQEKALVGAFSVIVKTGCETDGSFHSTIPGPAAAVQVAGAGGGTILHIKSRSAGAAVEDQSWWE